MKKIQCLANAWTLLGTAVIVACGTMAFAGESSRGDARQTQSFDAGWRFLKADSAGAEMPEFDDATWRQLDLPHDWSIEGSFAETNRTGGAGGFLPAGVGWYRKHFTLPPDYATRSVFIDFDGVMANSDVWIDGFHLGKRPNGYVSFRYELTGHLVFGAGKTNVLAVRADNSKQPASRWYAGAGIYRHVRLIITDPVHIDQWATFVTTPKVSADEAVVRVQTTVVNQSDTSRQVTVQATILSPDGQTQQSTEVPTQTLAAGKSAQFQMEITVKKPQLWDLDRPNLYRAITEVRAAGVTLDEDLAPFGIRDARFEAATGFWLNGRNFKIKGVCLHHDASAFGAAVPLRAWERRLEQLRQLGVNAIRTAHNPPAPEFLDLCDRLGFLVMDEFFDCWTVGKNPYDYHLEFNEWSKLDARDTIRRDRNHPSVILYSVGNEIHDTPKAELARSILKGLVEVCHENDPTRPVTQALFRPNVSHDYDNGLADLLNVIGTNYRDTELLEAWRARPARKIIGTEQGHDRRIWLACRDNAPHAGQFLWSGIDYLGESRRWPVIAAGSGLLDRTGSPKAMAFERASWWSDKSMVFATRRIAATRGTSTDPGFEPLLRRQVLFPDWTPTDPGPHEENLEVYSNCEEVELVLNGKSLGSQSRPADAAPRTWKIAFEPGTLKAIGKNKGQEIAAHELRTAGKSAKIVLAVDRNKLAADWDEVSYVRAAVVDENGVLVPDASDLIAFKLSGSGVIAAVDSGDNSSHEPFQASERHAFQGLCFAIVKATGPLGKITLTASAPGLTAASVTIEALASKSSTAASAARLPTLFLIGDSTVNNSTRGQMGWGTPIASHFDKTKIIVQNRARGGRSSRTYLTEGLWDEVLNAMQPGDFVLMQFGHNDGGPLTEGRARASLKGDSDQSQQVTNTVTGRIETVHTYGWYMRKYAADAKARGATPIVLSLVPRNMWRDGKVNRASNDYGKWAAEAAKAEDALFIDLNEIVARHYEESGQEKVQQLYFGPTDHTHTTPIGAELNAASVVEGLRALAACPLTAFLSDKPQPVAAPAATNSGAAAPTKAAEPPPAPAFWQWAAKPPMGWNSWDCFATTVTEAQTKAQADVMAAKLAAHGWQYVVVDIQWYEPNARSFNYRKDAPLVMDGFGRLLPATNRFPSAVGGAGFKPLADYVHGKGLKLGIHLLRGIPRQAVRVNTPVKGTSFHAADIADTNSVCAWNGDMFGVDMTKPGAQEYYDSVFALIASWDVDFVKVDDLSRPYARNRPEVEAIRKAIDRTGRPVVLSLSPGETPVAEGEHVMHHANMWRISDDFWDKWPELVKQFERCRKWEPFIGTGHFPDADMLPLGVIDLGRRKTHFTPDEQFTLMTLWSIARSPLIMGGDLTKLDEFTLGLLTNDEVLTVNQNSAGNKQLFNRDGFIAWLADAPSSPDKYLALFNTRNAPAQTGAPTGAQVSVKLAELGFSGACRVRDLWRNSNAGEFTGEFAPEIRWHGAGLYRISTR